MLREEKKSFNNTTKGFLGPISIFGACSGCVIWCVHLTWSWFVIYGRPQLKLTVMFLYIFTAWFLLLFKYVTYLISWIKAIQTGLDGPRDSRCHAVWLCADQCTQRENEDEMWKGVFTNVIKIYNFTYSWEKRNGKWMGFYMSNT